MGFLSDHPHTSITDTIDRLTSSRESTLEVELGPLVSLIKIGSNEGNGNDYDYTVNQEEAARALRKKLKYGNRLQQSRSLDLMDLFISQGIRFSVLYNDDKLVERLQVIGLNQGSDGNGHRYSSKVVKKCARYLISWNDFIRSDGLERMRCYESILMVAREVSAKYLNPDGSLRRSRGQGSRRNGFMDDNADDSIQFQSADDKYRIPHIDLRKEGPKIRVVISDALAAAIALQNSLITLPQGKNAADDEQTTSKFIQARTIRRKVLRYLQLVTEGDFLGSLIHANDELVTALSAYDKRCTFSELDGNDDDNEDDFSSADDSLANYESDSDDDYDDHRNIYNQKTQSSLNPFGDDNKL